MTIRHVSASGISLLLHLLAALIVTWLPWGTRFSSEPRGGSAIAVFTPSVEASTGDSQTGADGLPAIPSDDAADSPTQAPSMQALFGGHATPHAPQCFGSFKVTLHTPSQSSCCGGHGPPESPAPDASSTRAGPAIPSI